MPENVNTSPLGDVVEQDSELDTRPVMVDVSHVSMVFNMANEQLNSLKEYAIALARRELMFKEFRALDDVSFTVRKGDVFGILGTNGSGKSTMLKIIAGVLEPSEGTCTINGNIAPLIELGAGFDMELTAKTCTSTARCVSSWQIHRSALRRDRGICRGREIPRHAHEELLVGYGGAHRVRHCHGHRAGNPYR